MNSKYLLKSSSNVSLFLSNLTKPLATVAQKVKATELKTYDDIPGPKPLPFLGNLLEFKSLGGEYDFMDVRGFQAVIQSKFGDLVRWTIFNQKSVYVFNPDHIKQVFNNDLSTPYRDGLEPLIILHKKIGINNTLLNSNNERWRKMRSASNPILARPQTIHSYISNQNLVANELVDVIENKFKETNSDKVLNYKNFNDMLRLLALEYVSEIVFNQRLRCIDERTRLPDVTELVKQIDQFFVSLGYLCFGGLPTWKYYPTKKWKHFEQVATYVYDVVRKYIHEAQDKLAKNEFSDESKKTILVQFLERREKYGMEINDVVAIMTDLLIAGVDTTATTIYFLLYELGKNPDVQQNLFDEINRVIGKDKNITEEHIEQMKYLKHCVKESLRIYNNAPANARKLTRDLVLDDYLIPKGTNMVMPTTFITKHEKYFKNANKFDPSRWDREEKGTEATHPYANLPFGFGVRMCIGRRIAEQEIYLTAIKLIQSYRLEYNGPTPGFKFGLVLAPDIPLNLNFIKRN